MVDGLVQATGAGLFIAGIAKDNQILVRDRSTIRMETSSLFPTVKLGLGSTSLAWRF